MERRSRLQGRFKNLRIFFSLKSKLVGLKYLNSCKKLDAGAGHATMVRLKMNICFHWNDQFVLALL